MGNRHQPNGSALTVRVAHLEEANKGTKISIGELHSRIDQLGDEARRRYESLSEKVGSLGRYDLAAVVRLIATVATTAIMVGGTLWGLAIAPLSNEVKAEREARFAFQKQVEDRAWRAERNTPNKEALEQQLARIGDKLAAVEQEQNRRRDVNVTRGELDLRRMAWEQQIGELRAAMAELRKEMSATFPATRTLDELFKRIDRLENVKLRAPEK